MVQVFNKTADGTPDLALPLFAGGAPEASLASALDMSNLKEKAGSIVLYTDSASGGDIRIDVARNKADAAAGTWYAQQVVTVAAGTQVTDIPAYSALMRFVPLSGGLTSIDARYTQVVFGGSGSGSSGAATPASGLDSTYFLVQDPVTGTQYFARWNDAEDGSSQTLTYYDLAGAVATPANTPQAVNDVEIATETQTLEAIAAGTGYSIGDVITRTRLYNTDTGASTGVIYYNESTMANITPAAGDLGIYDDVAKPEAQYNATPPTLVDTAFSNLQVDVNGNLKTANQNSTPTGQYNAALPTLTDGDTTPLQTDINGRQINEPDFEYNATAPTLTDGAITKGQTDVNGNLKVALTDRQIATTDMEVFSDESVAFTTTLASFKRGSVIISSGSGSATIAFGTHTVTISVPGIGLYEFNEIAGSSYNFPVTVTPGGGATVKATFTA